jgi:hypothetical protein
LERKNPWTDWHLKEGAMGAVGEKSPQKKNQQLEGR